MDGHEEPTKGLKKEILITPCNADAYNRLGIFFKDQGKTKEAITSCMTSLIIKPNFPEAHYKLAIALKDQGDLDAAIASYKTALKLEPMYPDALINLGNALQEQGKLDAAISSYKTAIKLKPNYPEAHNNLGVVLKDKGNISAAITSYMTAIQLKPSYSDAHNNLGIALKEQGKHFNAIASYKTAVQLNPYFPSAYFNLGIAHQEQGNLSAAIASYRSATKLKPNFSEAQKNLSMAELLTGDFRRGWQRYEYRFHCQEDTDILLAHPSCERWNGESIKQGEQLLLIAEQGLGDTMQFMRYTTTLKSRGICVRLCAQLELHRLIETSGIDPSPLTPKAANRITSGKWTPLLSLPKHLGVNSENPIVTEPYLKTTEKLNTKWAGILSAEQRPIVGINWQGNPKAEKTCLRGRSVALNTFARILKCNRISLLSLQKGYGSEQLDNCDFKDQFVTCQNQINETWDFLETAAIIANCDMVITTDTSVAHLAGGIGKTTWLLLHRVPDWRWGIEGSTTFWYPSMRLFRQRERGNWEEVMERVAEELQRYFGSNSVAT